MGVILRTAGLGGSKPEVRRDYVLPDGAWGRSAS